jgi:hypothetical protein
MRLRTLVGVSWIAIGCGASAVEAPAPRASMPKVEAAPSAPDAMRHASDEIRRRWPFGDDPEFALYGDLGGFAKTELVSGLLPALLAMAKDSMSDVQRECVRTLVGAIGEIAVGANGRGALYLVRFDEAAVKPAPSVCLQEVAAGPPVDLAGAKAYGVLGSAVVTLQPGLLMFGKKELVEEALAVEEASRWPKGLDLPKDTHLSWHARMPEERVSAMGTFASSHDFFRIDVKADLESDGDAADLESKIVAGRKMLASRMAAQPAARPALPLFDSFHLARSGRTLTFDLDLREAPVAQARDVGILAGVAISGVRRYLAEAKVAEARNMLANIARSEVEAWPALPAAKRKLASLPPVPKEIPRATKYQSTSVDWKRWEGLKFSMNAPQYFQYEVVASKDGKRAEIIARGDLDGDGKASEFKLVVKVNPKTNALEVEPGIEEKDPSE